MLALLFIALLSVGATSPPRLNVEVEECEPVVCVNDDDCYTFQPQDAVTSASAPKREEPLPGPCQPNPCHHGGVCEIPLAHRGDALRGYLCHCGPGYDGLHCQHNVNECESSPCRNGGLCTDLEANYSCFCAEEFTGRNCQHKMDACVCPHGLDTSASASECETTALVSDSTFYGGKAPHDGSPVEKEGVLTEVKAVDGSPSETELDPGPVNPCNGTVPTLGTSKPVGRAETPVLMTETETHGCSGPLGMEGGIIADSQLSASSSHGNLFGLQQWLPHLARLHRTGLVNAWSPAKSDRWPWIQVNLRRPMRLTGIMTQGARRMGSAEFVKSFKVAYSNNGVTWTMLKSEDSQQDIVFSGNTDSHSLMANTFSPPIEAEFIRIYPQVCKAHCSLRMELMGCELTGCSEPLGLKGGQLLDSQLSASSVHRTLGMGLLSWGPKHGRLDRRGKVNAWSAARNDQKQWIQVDLLAPTKITGVITQGAKDFGRVQFVGSYKLAYSNDGIAWTVYQDENQHSDKVFQGNSDNKTHKKNFIVPAIFGRFLRLIPWSWYRRITLRLEILGCSEEE